MRAVCEAAVTAAKRRAELLVFTGGLGPTYDDMTKTAVCAALDTPLVFHPEVADEIRRYFDTVFHREMPACNLQQAYLPEGCTVFHNPVGTAPGCAFSAGGVTAVLLPGVPSECRYLAEHGLLPYLARLHGQVIRSHDLRIFGLTEPQVQELLSDLHAAEDDLTPGALRRTGEVSLHLTARAAMRPPAKPGWPRCWRRCGSGWATSSTAWTCRGWRSARVAVSAERARTDPLRRRELHRRPDRQAHHGCSRRVGSVSAAASCPTPTR